MASLGIILVNPVPGAWNNPLLVAPKRDIAEVLYIVEVLSYMH